MTQTKSKVLDAVAEGLSTIIPAGTRVTGCNMETSEGIYIGGEFHGSLKVAARTMWVDSGAKVTGKIEAHGDAWVFGEVGQPGDETLLRVHGQLHLCQGSIVHARIQANDFIPYSGAQISGVIETLATDNVVPPARP